MIVARGTGTEDRSSYYLHLSMTYSAAYSQPWACVGFVEGHGVNNYQTDAVQ